jgi:hypothetical protein
MAESNSTPAKSAPLDATPPAMNTRGQQQRSTSSTDNVKDNSDTDQESQSDTNNKKKDKDKNTTTVFKGNNAKLNGNVFQLAEEGRKANQFSLTLKALSDYAYIEFDHPKDIASLFKETCEKPTIEEPPDEPPANPTNAAKRVGQNHRLYIKWKYECDEYYVRETDLETNMGKLFTIILQQSSQAVKMKLEATAGYNKAYDMHDCHWLLVTLKNVCHRFEHTENRFTAITNAKANIFNYKQSGNQTTPDYYDTFKEMLSVLESYNGRIHDTIEAEPNEDNITSLTTTEEKETYMKEKCHAALFLRNSDYYRFDNLRTELANSFKFQ